MIKIILNRSIKKLKNKMKKKFVMNVKMYVIILKFFFFICRICYEVLMENFVEVIV